MSFDKPDCYTNGSRTRYHYEDSWPESCMERVYAYEGKFLRTPYVKLEDYNKLLTEFNKFKEAINATLDSKGK